MTAVESRPLFLTADEALLEELLRLSAAAGVVPDVARDAAAGLRWWSSASMVFVGADLAGPLARAEPGRRPGVHLVVLGGVPDALFKAALDVGAEDVAQLPASEAWLVETLTDAADGVTGNGLLISVLGGSGGAGSSVFAAALALTLSGSGAGPEVSRAPWSTLLVDADPMGAGLDRVVGMRDLAGARWQGLSSATGRLSARHLREALPRRRGLSVLTWAADRPSRSAPPAGPSGPAGLQPFAVREVLSAGRRGHDAVVVDLPRHPEPIGEEMLSRSDHVVVVSGATLSAVTSASRLTRRLDGLAASTHLVVRGSGAVDAHRVADLLRVDLATTMPDQRGLDEMIDLGAGPIRSRRCALAKAARLVARRVSAPGTAVA